jgi:hypothetical protein
MCKSFASIDCRDPVAIQDVLASHEWSSMSSDRTPMGMISRFACSRCGDEYVVMLTSPKAIERENGFDSELEVSAGTEVVS